ncbi:MAG TPA: Arc family DNA binding domain-containing protein [Rhodanobacteraceae bacterium]|nr:Arc family DNA binding domain-containing protein [Rhodanobacteraceae bacterium]
MSTDKDKKAYPLRINAAVLDAMQRWSNDELRSLNAQIEYVLRDALRKAGRLKTATKHHPPSSH